MRCCNMEWNEWHCAAAKIQRIVMLTTAKHVFHKWKWISGFISNDKRFSAFYTRNIWTSVANPTHALHMIVMPISLHCNWLAEKMHSVVVHIGKWIKVERSDGQHLIRSTGTWMSWRCIVLLRLSHSKILFETMWLRFEQSANGNDLILEDSCTRQ